ncbi:MAG: hypothetical protein AABX48_01275 [Nanoarchaeota archaeon]
MDYCYFTGVSEEKEPLFDVIYQDKIVKASESAVHELGLVVLRKPRTIKPGELDKKQSVYERLSRMSGVDRNFMKQNRADNVQVRKEITERQKEVSLRDIVEKKYKEEHPSAQVNEKRDDLVDNFHWIIMRARRIKKVTQEQMAKDLNVHLDLVKNAEKGFMGSDSGFIYKLESYLNIKLFKEVQPHKTEAERIIMQRPVQKEVTISSLKSMSEKYKEDKIKEGYEGNPFEIEEDLSADEDVNFEGEKEDTRNFGDIIFGRKR